MRRKKDDTVSSDEQMTSLNNEIEVVQQKMYGINERIEQINSQSEHISYSIEEAPRALEKARYRLREAKERDVESDATREIARLEYLQTLEADFVRLEQETPVHLAKMRDEQKRKEEQRLQLHAEISEHQARLAELLPELRALQQERAAQHQEAGEECYNRLLQSFNELAAKERDLALALAETKIALLNKSEEAPRVLSSWQGLARRFEDETAQIVRVSQSERIDSSAESLKLAKARRGGMIIGESV